MKKIVKISFKLWQDTCFFPQVKERDVHIGERLAIFRKYLSIGQKDVALKTGISRSYITNVETGKQAPSFDFLYKLIVAYNLSFEWLILGRGQMFMIDENHIFNKLNEEHIKFLEMLIQLEPERQTKFLKAFYELLEDK